MNTSVVALYALLIQQALFGALWLALVYLRVARRASLNWALGTVFVTAGLSVVVMRAELPRWLGLWGAAVLLFVGFMWLRRGLLAFARVEPRDALKVTITAAYAALMGAITAWGSNTWYVVMGSVPLGGVMISAGWAVRKNLQMEFGHRAAQLTTLPVLAIGGVIAARGLYVLSQGPSEEALIHAAGGTNLKAALMFVACGMVANLGLCALVATRMVFSLQRASERDHLTGLYNRRTLESRIAAQWLAEHARGMRLSLLSIDIDHFKAINDAHGHPAGDVVLRRVAETLGEQLRPGDVAGRVGGEEFWVLLPGTTGQAAAPMAERIQRAVRELDVTVRDTVPVRVTVSMGLAEVDPNKECVDAALQRLDEALYRAKDGGRNRWEWATPAGMPLSNVIPLVPSAAQHASSASASPASPGTPRTTDDCSVV